MRAEIKYALVTLGVLIGLGGCVFVGPTLFFLLFHSDWTPVDYLLTVSDGASVLRLEVVDAQGALVWAIENPAQATVDHLDYGQVPRGFVQRVPAIGAPRKLVRGERLGFSYCDSLGGGAFVQLRVGRGESLQHGLAYWGRRTDGVLCDRGFVYDNWSVPGG